MKRAELIALIDSLKGQGNQVDLDGVLALVLNAVAVPLEVTDITALTSDQLDSLEVGSIVVKKTGDERHAYIVNFKDSVSGKLLLTYADWQNVEGVYYEKGESGWAYVQTDNTHIAV